MISDNKLKLDFQKCAHIWLDVDLGNKKGLARTQIPTNKNYAFEFPTFGEIAGVSHPEVQWNSLALEDPPW